MEKIVKHIKGNKQEYIKELTDFLKIPSISTLHENKKDIQDCAEFVKTMLLNAGLSKAEIYQTEGHPVVYGEWLGAPGKPTVLIYGHYDVQPVDPLDLWDTPPFDPVIKNGKIYARGATDDKGQVMTHIKSVEAYFKKKGSLPLNVKFVIEGEEEIGSPNLQPFIKQHKSMLKCDAILISDTSLYAEGVPTLTYGLRGMAQFEVEVFGPNQDLHSGAFGGAVANPINVLSRIISKLHDNKGKVAVPGFYDDVLRITPKDKKAFNKLPFNEKKLAKELGVREFSGETKYTVLERRWARPTLDCNGITGGFTGKGLKTIIPSKASAKISCRLVPNQDPKKIASLCKKYIESIAPKSVRVQVTLHSGGAAVLSPLDHKATKAAAAAMSKAFRKETVFIREGGSIPIIAAFNKILKAPPVIMGFGLDSENLHSPNEHFNLKHFELGMLSSAFFFQEFSNH